MNMARLSLLILTLTRLKSWTVPSSSIRMMRKILLLGSRRVRG
uniref:Uncharacterized protein n=1 Tax=Corynebacterium phage HS01 TaxID=3056389 RepID=A0AA50ACT7_9VIRU|nr:MAG: protein of unknown function (DUF2014) [Corynebacterium phage HS01]